ncbi:MAG: sulfotransferase [Pseudomonadota bacterium]
MTASDTGEMNWTVSSIVQQAQAVDGLQDFGDEAAFGEALNRLVISLDREAALNALGVQVLRQRVVDILANRLRVEAWIKRHPEILDEEICQPLVIVGLPRTGTTMLHRTIAADHRMSAPLWFETRYPCPPLDWDPTMEDPRRVAGVAEMKAMLDANPDLLSVHPMDAEGPDEDIMLLEQSFYSYNIQSFAHVPGFDAWIESQNHRPGYDYLKLLLKFLQWQRRQTGQTVERWVLKAPHHLHFLDLVFEVFPDARIVQSHRDPVETIPSLASMIYELWRIYSDEADPTTVGEQWARKFAEGMQRSLAVREAVSSDRFLDLWFADTVSDPLGEIARVYDFIGMRLTPEAEAEMRQWQDFNRRELRPGHDYSLDTFGFTEEALCRQFAEYRERYILSRS